MCFPTCNKQQNNKMAVILIIQQFRSEYKHCCLPWTLSLVVSAHICLTVDIPQTLLGMIDENENDADGILAILKSLHTYVPRHGDDEKRVYGDHGVVGYHLSVERTVNGQMSLANGFTPEERVEGLHFEIADWHAGNKFLEVCMSSLFWK